MTYPDGFSKCERMINVPELSILCKNGYAEPEKRCGQRDALAAIVGYGESAKVEK